jgi:hypothetical protein
MTRCPICGAEAGQLDKTGDADGIDCTRHGKFKVSGTVLSTKRGSVQAEWERALERARSRKRSSDPWPTVISTDF